MRKVIGASRKQLIKQFLGESYLITIIAAVLSLIIIEAASPLLSDITGWEAGINLFNNITALYGLAGVILYAL